MQRRAHRTIACLLAPPAEVVEIFITITGAYITFFVSEDIFGVSGILASVALGFLMAAVGNSKISPSVQHPLHTVWCVLPLAPARWRGAAGCAAPRQRCPADGPPVLPQGDARVGRQHCHFPACRHHHHGARRLSFRRPGASFRPCAVPHSSRAALAATSRLIAPAFQVEEGRALQNARHSAVRAHAAEVFEFVVQLTGASQIGYNSTR